MNGNLTRLPLGEQRHCEFCEIGNVTASMKQQEFQYGEGDKAVQLAAYVPVWTCDACGEAFTDGEAERIRHDVVCEHLGRWTPDQLRASRKSAGYSQESWAELTKFGIASIKRWESGNQIQSASADLLLKLLDAPENRDATMERKSACGTRGQPTFQVLTIEKYSRQASLFELRPGALN